MGEVLLESKFEASWVGELEGFVAWAFGVVSRDLELEKIWESFCFSPSSDDSCAASNDE